MEVQSVKQQANTIVIYQYSSGKPTRVVIPSLPDVDDDDDLIPPLFYAPSPKEIAIHLVSGGKPEIERIPALPDDDDDDLVLYPSASWSTDGESSAKAGSPISTDDKSSNFCAVEESVKCGPSLTKEDYHFFYFLFKDGIYMIRAEERDKTSKSREFDDLQRKIAQIEDLCADWNKLRPSIKNEHKSFHDAMEKFCNEVRLIAEEVHALSDEDWIRNLFGEWKDSFKREDVDYKEVVDDAIALKEKMEIYRQDHGGEKYYAIVQSDPIFEAFDHAIETFMIFGGRLHPSNRQWNPSINWPSSPY